MAIHKVDTSKGEPNTWKVEKVADVGWENFVKEILDLRDIVDAGLIMEPRRADVKQAFTAILMDGLTPAFLELQEIRELSKHNRPLMEQWQLYEDLCRKLWKSYKVLMQKAAALMDFDIGFLFGNDKTFAEGLTEFRRLNPRLRPNFDKLLEKTRTQWQNDLAKFRNTFLEHHEGNQPADRRKVEKFYKPANAERLFDTVWRTIMDILVMLAELHMPEGTRLVEQDPNDPGPRWEKRFRYDCSAYFKSEPGV